MDKVDINSATREELESLHGIGAGLAGQITSYREEHGGFRSLDELEQLSYFRDLQEGDKQFFKEKLTVRPETMGRALEGTLDLNRANRGDLERIAGIGEGRAEVLISERRDRGGFRDLDEIDELPRFRDMDPVERQAIKSRLTLT